MFDINGGEWLVLLVVAVIVIGPERLPGYAEQLGRLARRGREFVNSARTRIDDELGEEGTGVDWSSLDPRRYDPRRIVRDALLDDDTRSTLSDVAGAVGLRTPGGAVATAGATDDASAGSGPAPGAAMPFRADSTYVSGAVPWDDEAT